MSLIAPVSTRDALANRLNEVENFRQRFYTLSLTLDDPKRKLEYYSSIRDVGNKSFHGEYLTHLQRRRTELLESLDANYHVFTHRMRLTENYTTGLAEAHSLENGFS